MASAPKNSVWSAMNYPPPKGRCNFKSSLLGPACPCLRFMLHPVKAATSFECDGCNHHASFHSLENPTEDAIVARWEAQEAEHRMERQAIQGANKKRKRIAGKAANEEEVLQLPGGFEIVDVDEMAEVETVASEDDAEVQEVVGTGVRATTAARKPLAGARTGAGVGVRKPRATVAARARKT